MERMSEVNASSDRLNYWCHTCKSKVQVTIHENQEITCKYIIVGDKINEWFVG